MAIETKLVQHGDDYAIVLEREVFEFFGITPDSILEISTPDGQTILIRPVPSKTCITH